ncbi:LysR family transcriptional regulator [Amycolatopsis alkalitolerans]|nr:LysR family transcriptional regulator [Amycolatopsis alkalitolerans]
MILPPSVPELVDLDLLLCVERLGSLSKAARAHAMSQPTVSTRIQALERRLGLRLLERTYTGCSLTPSGRMVAQWARGVVEAADKLAAGTAALRDVQRGRLRLVSSLTVADNLMPCWLIELRERLPHMAVELQVRNSRDVVEQVAAGQIDIGFVEDPCDHSGLAQVVVGGDELVVVVAPGHPWAGRTTPVTRAELTEVPLVLRERGSGTRETLERALGGLDDGHPHLELGSTNAVKGTVLAGAGAAVLSRMSVRSELENRELVQVPLAGVRLVRQFRASWRRNVELSPAAQILVTIASRKAPETTHLQARHTTGRSLAGVDAA